MWLNNYVISGWQEAAAPWTVAKAGALGWPTIARLSAKECQEFQMGSERSAVVLHGQVKMN